MENEKKSYLQKFAEMILEWDKKIDELKQQGNETSLVVKEDCTKTTAELKSKKQEAEEKLKQLKSVGVEGWEELKKGADLAISDMSKALANALSKFKEQK
jgi:hypothetical protein